MQARIDWVLIIFGTQVIKKKRPVRPVFPDYLSVSYDYGLTYIRRSEDVQDNLKDLYGHIGVQISDNYLSPEIGSERVIPLTLKITIKLP